MIINAFGYDHSFSDYSNYTNEEREMITDAPYIHILSGKEEMIEQAALPMDAALFWTDAQEALVFGYEDMTLQQYDWLEMLGVEVEMLDRTAA